MGHTDYQPNIPSGSGETNDFFLFLFFLVMAAILIKQSFTTLKSRSLVMLHVKF